MRMEISREKERRWVKFCVYIYTQELFVQKICVDTRFLENCVAERSCYLSCV